MSEQVFGPHLVQRCRTLWWNVYILDIRLSAQLGAPSSIRDEEITMGLPLTESGGSSTAVILSLSVKLSRLLATIMTGKLADVIQRWFLSSLETPLRALLLTILKMYSASTTGLEALSLKPPTKLSKALQRSPKITTRSCSQESKAQPLHG